MHSSRMRTGRSLTVCCSLLPGWGVSGPGGCLVRGVGGSGPGGRGVSGPRRGSGPGGVSGPGGGWVCLVWGGISQHALRQTPPVDRILDTRL